MGIEIGDRVTILRNGQWVTTRDVVDISVTEIIELSRLQFDNPVEAARAVRGRPAMTSRLTITKGAVSGKRLAATASGPCGWSVVKSPI